MKIIDLTQTFTDKMPVYPGDPDVSLTQAAHIEKDLYRGEVGYYLGQGHTSKGYMGRAMTALVNYAFGELQYETLYGKVHEGNTASQRVLTQAGFRESQRENDEIIFTRGKADK